MNPETCATTMKNDSECYSIGAESSAALATGKTEATFFNGKQLEVQYIFDLSRMLGDRVLIERDCLLPVLGGFVLPGINKFTSIQEIIRLTSLHVHLDKCSGGPLASCRCHLIGDFGERRKKVELPSSDKCEYGHFHHFCPVHLQSWLDHYLNMLVLFQESRQHFDEEISDIFLALDIKDRVYFYTGERPISEFLIRHALEIY